MYPHTVRLNVRSGPAAIPAGIGTSTALRRLFEMLGHYCMK